MSSQAPPLPRPARSGFSALLAETRTLYVRSMRKLMRRPIALYFSLIQPIIWLLLFGQIFNRITRFPGAAHAFGDISYFQFFMPAVILQTVLFGAGQSGIGILSDMDSGFLDKLLTTPIHRVAILLGRILGDLSRLVAQGVVIVLLAWIFGQAQEPRVHYVYGVAGVLGALVIALLFGIGLAGLNIFIALRTRSTESTFLVSNFLTLPLLFTSSAQLPLELLPHWLQQTARFNPVTYAVNAMRFFFNGPRAVPGLDPVQEITWALAYLGAIALVTMTLAVRSFRRNIR